MINVMFYYNGIQAEEELHDDDVVAKLAEGQTMERAGEYWTIMEIQPVLIAGEPARIDVVRIFLTRPM
jgi:hypothetical protein